MPNCSPQRYIANDRSEARTASVVASSVLPVDDQVLSLKVARAGTAQASLSGSYTGTEEATYDVEILDTLAATTTIPTAPVFAGAGSGTLVDISATGINAQDVTVECADSGKPELFAAVSFEGVKLIAREVGAIGNDINLEIDQSGLIFTESNFSLLSDLKTGDGDDGHGLEGAGFDWSTAVLGADNNIPLTAKRVAFGQDTSTIYLQYKVYTDNHWLYHFVPAIKRDISKGTRVSFVTGGRTITVTDGITPETYPALETVYDFLNAIKTTSALLDVAGVVAFDRSPTGQAALELLARTDAHVEPSSGEGSPAARGFVDTFANSNASTELVTAECFAVTSKDHPLARLGAERWKLRGSVSGDLGDIVTAAPYVHPDDKFGLTIPLRLPNGYGEQRGRFTHVSTDYVAREGDPPPDPPPICMVSMKLGTEAVDQSVTLVYTKRPSDDCNCSNLPAPFVGGPCLGIIEEDGGSAVGYSAANRTRLIALYQWQTETVRANSDVSPDGTYLTPFAVAHQDLFISSPVFNDSLLKIVANFETTLAAIDALALGMSPDIRADAESAWDDAFTELQADISDLFTPTDLQPLSIASDRYNSRLEQVLITGGISPLGKSDAGTLVSGDGCWRDYGDAYYWTVVGSQQGAYAPAYTNHVYYSTRRASEEGTYYSSKEFGFQVNVKPECVSLLKVGDTINLSIGDAGWATTYNVGDVLTLPIIAEQALYLAGGRDSDNAQTWFVTGSEDGAFPPYVFDPDTPLPYTLGGGLAFELSPGAIDFAKGDRFKFSLTGGHYQWRKDGGPWVIGSPPDEIPTGPVLIDSGLSLQFTPGVSPSFVAGDRWSFRALQPWAASNVQTPTPSRWRWSGATADEVFDFGAPKTIDTAAIAAHTIPAGATVTVEGGTAPGVYTWSEVMTWRAGPMVHEFAAAQSARYVRVSLTAATDGSIAWLWLGAALSTSLSADVTLRRSYKLQRGDGPLYQGGKTLGAAVSADVSFTEGAMDEADYTALVALLDWTKLNDDEPFLFVPQITRPAEVLFARVVADDVDIEEISNYNRDAAFDRRFSAHLGLSGVWQ